MTFRNVCQPLLGDDVVAELHDPNVLRFEDTRPVGRTFKLSIRRRMSSNRSAGKLHAPWVHDETLTLDQGIRV